MANATINRVQKTIVASLRKAPDFTIYTADIGTFRQAVGLQKVSTSVMFEATRGLRGKIVKIKSLNTGQTRVRLRARYR